MVPLLLLDKWLDADLLPIGELNTNLHPWQDMYFSGPDPEQVPFIISSAPVEWNYHGTLFKLDFNAGITAVSQRSDDGMLVPELGWYVTHDNSSEESGNNQINPERMSRYVKHESASQGGENNQINPKKTLRTRLKSTYGKKKKT